MTSEDMINDFIQLGVKAYKKNSKDCLVSRKLARHEPVMIDGYEFSYWWEYGVYKMGEYIHKLIPNSKVDVELAGNDSTLKVELNDEEQKTLNKSLYAILNKIDKTKVFL